jgi:hypothetical protein
MVVTGIAALGGLWVAALGYRGSGKAAKDAAKGASDDRAECKRTADASADKAKELRKIVELAGPVVSDLPDGATNKQSPLENLETVVKAQAADAEKRFAEFENRLKLLLPRRLPGGRLCSDHLIRLGAGTPPASRPRHR